MKKAFWFSMILGVLQAVAAIIAWQYMPELLPANWGVGGEVTRWTGRWILFLPAMITIGVTTLLYLVPKIDPKGENIKRSGKGYPAVMIIIALLGVLIFVMTILAGLGREVSVHIIVPIFVGVLFIVLGNYLPQAKQNYSYGIRMPWTLANEEVWTKTHRVGGIIFVIMGLLWIGSAFLPVPLNLIVPLAVLVIGMGYCVMYSYLTYKKVTTENEKL